MEELYEIVKSLNRLKDKIIELSMKIDKLLKPPPYEQTANEFVDETGACRILHVSPRSLFTLRNQGSITYIKNGKKILYRVSDLKSYLQKVSVN